MLTTPQSIFPEINRLITDRRLSSEPIFIPVINESGATADNCSEEVRKKISIDGGKAVFGWKIWLFPNVLFECIPHAVWGSKDNSLIDVTPNVEGENNVLFIQDDTVFFRDIPLPALRYAILENKLVSDFIAVSSRCDLLFTEICKSAIPGMPIDNDEFYDLMELKGAMFNDIVIKYGKI